jgi:hypothetical protein
MRRHKAGRLPEAKSQALFEYLKLEEEEKDSGKEF